MTTEEFRKTKIGITNPYRRISKSKMLREIERSPIDYYLSCWLEVNLSVYSNIRYSFGRFLNNHKDVFITFFDYLTLWLKLDSNGVCYWFNRGFKRDQYQLFKRDVQQPYTLNNVGIGTVSNRNKWRLQHQTHMPNGDYQMPINRKCRAVVVNGNPYPTMTIASLNEQLKLEVVWWRVNSDTYSDYYYLN